MVFFVNYPLTIPYPNDIHIVIRGLKFLEEPWIISMYVINTINHFYYCHE